MARSTFGVSTHLYLAQRLSRDHLLDIAAHGFEAVELFAARTHVDYHNESAVADLQQWLAEAGLSLQSIHAPVALGYAGGRPSDPLSIASADADARDRALQETERALHIARRIEARTLVVHAGGNRDAARRSLEALQRTAAPLGVRIAVEVLAGDGTTAGSVVHLIEEDLEGADVGVCLDFGHAHVQGDLLDAIETASGHLVAVDLHDNRGRRDEHLVPFDGTIDWPAALTAIQKVGYDGPFTMELAARGPAKETLARARKARERIERMLAI